MSNGSIFNVIEASQRSQTNKETKDYIQIPNKESMWYVKDEPTFIQLESAHQEREVLRWSDVP